MYRLFQSTVRRPLFQSSTSPLPLLSRSLSSDHKLPKLEDLERLGPLLESLTNNTFAGADRTSSELPKASKPPRTLSDTLLSPHLEKLIGNRSVVAAKASSTLSLSPEESKALYAWGMGRNIGLTGYIAKRLGISPASWEAELASLRKNTDDFMHLRFTSLRLLEEATDAQLAEATTLVKKGVIFDRYEREALVRDAMEGNDPSLLAIITSQLRVSDLSFDPITYCPSFDPFSYWAEPRGSRGREEMQMDLLEPIVKQGAYNTLAFFINEGFDVTLNSHTFTLLHQLANRISHEGHLQPLKYLIKAGAPVNAVDFDWHYSALLRVIDLCEIPELAYKAVKILIENGANPNLTDNWQKTALHSAATSNHFEIAVYLLENPHTRVNLHAVNSEGCHAAHLLVRTTSSVNIPFLQYLINQGIDVTLPDNKGKSVIDYLDERGLLDEVHISKPSARP